MDELRNNLEEARLVVKSIEDIKNEKEQLSSTITALNGKLEQALAEDAQSKLSCEKLCEQIKSLEIEIARKDGELANTKVRCHF